MKYDYHVIVIGAGSAGLVVASGVSTFGAKTALIEADKMGGDCLNTGCVPSKTFLKSAHLARDIQNSPQYGITSSLGKINLSKIMKQVQSVIKEIEPHDSKKRYERLGVKVYSGKAEILDDHTVQVNKKNITGKYIVIATGSDPVIPPIPGLKQVPYLTNKNIFKLKTLPKHLLVLGAGPIGMELGQGFKHLGSNVSIIDMNDRLFLKDDPEVGMLMEKKMREDGINLQLSSKVIEVTRKGRDIIVTIEKNNQKQKIKGDTILAALGRRPAVDGLGLENLGLQTNKRGMIITNKKMQTNIKNIYACGDVTGPYQFTHMAGYQAGIVVRNIIFKLGSKVNYSTVPWTTYTKPEVAHVGYTEPWAKSLGLFKKSVLYYLDQIDRAKAENDRDGFLKFILNKKNQLIGATLVGEKAGEMIPLATLAIKQKLKPGVFLGLILSYPTEAEIYKFTALDMLKDSFKPWMKRIIQKFFL